MSRRRKIDNSLVFKTKETIQHPNFTQRVIQVNRKNHSATIDADTVKATYRQLVARAAARGANIDVSIRGLGPTRWVTFKAKDGDLRIDAFEEYWNGKVKDPMAFQKLSILQFSIYKYH